MIFIVVALLVIAACVAVPIYVARQRARRAAAYPRELPPLIFQMRSPPADGTMARVPERFAPQESEPVAPMEVASPLLSGTERAITVPVLRADPPASRAADTSETVHFRRPTDEALQLLPGRLEVVSGLTMPKEIRFVRIPGERPQLTLGREPGASPQDVALPSSTVSRKHARFDFSSGRWGVTNLSRTNPVVVNDETLSSTEGQRMLMDGDRIELGDVVLRFCAH